MFCSILFVHSTVTQVQGIVSHSEIHHTYIPHLVSMGLGLELGRGRGFKSLKEASSPYLPFLPEHSPAFSSHAMTAFIQITMRQFKEDKGKRYIGVLPAIIVNA